MANVGTVGVDWQQRINWDRLRTKLVTVDRPDTGHQSIRRGALAEPFFIAAGALSRNR